MRVTAQPFSASRSMSAQLELDLAHPARPTRPTLRVRAAHLARAGLRWTPVWVPLLFLGQLLWLGFFPAHATRTRLDQAESEVRARVEGLRQEEGELAIEARMLADTVYRERVRRSLIDPSAAPLTLERARSGAKP